MKRFVVLLVLFVWCVTCTGGNPGRALVFLISKTNWQDIPTAKKQQGNNILQNCTDAVTVMEWSWTLREKANTNSIWGFALFSGDAWVLRRKAQIDDTKIQQIKDIWESYGGIIRWTTNFWVELEASSLEPIP